MTISDELLDELLKGCKRPEDLLGDTGLMKELKVRLMERMLGAELTAHLGYEAGAEPPPEQTNRRNGVATKRVKGSDGEVALSVPRDRDGSFEPELVRRARPGSTVWMTSRRIGKRGWGPVFPTRHRPLCGRAVGARHPGASGGPLRPAGLARPDQPRHRCRSGRGPRVAAPGAGSDVPHCDL